MSTAYYQIYLNQVMSLASTLTIHSSATADAMNAGLSMGVVIDDLAIPPYRVDLNDNTTWKYYLNLQGLYHPTDIPMSIISLDTLQTIPFTVENLQINVATAKAYTYGSSYYDELVLKYPTQENLIRGILNPVTLTKDYETGQWLVPNDGTILWFDDALVESNETTLIPKLQTWLYRAMERWDVPGYRITDDLYAAAQLSVIYAHVPLKIMNIRLSACKTRHAHSFHITEYLASNGNLDVYLGAMSVRQKLWLYRNIQYIKRNAGKQSTFTWLIENILTNRGLPLAEWNMGHDISQMPSSLYPNIEFLRKPINLGFSLSGTDTKTIQEMFDLENPAARDNLIVETDAITTAQVSMENAKFNSLRTKILESNVTDLSDATPYTLTDALLNHWMYWAYTGRYSAVLGLTDPHTGAPFTIPVLDAFTTYLYAYNKANGITLPTVPDIHASHVQRDPIPTYTELLGLISSPEIPTSLIRKQLANLATLGNYISTEAFYSAVLDVQQGILGGLAIYTQVEDLYARAQMEIVTQRCYCDVYLPLDNNTPITYLDWFASKGYLFANYDEGEWGLLADQILKSATGIDLTNNRNLADIQASMLGIMARLSSYNVQFIQTINSSTIRVPEWNMARLGNIGSSGSALLQIDRFGLDVLDVNVQSGDLTNMDLYAGEGLDVAAFMTLKELAIIPLMQEVTLADNFIYTDQFRLTMINFSIPAETVQPIANVALNLISPNYVALSLKQLSQGFVSDIVTDYGALSVLDRETLKQRFLGAISTPIGSAIHQFILDGLQYPVEPDAPYTPPL